jgi:hypothetical protein
MTAVSAPTAGPPRTLGFRKGSGAGWRYTWHEGGPKDELRFECNECPYARVLGPRGLMKLGAMCCHADIINYGELPYTDFIRTQALCQGGDGCDSRFVRHATDAGDGWERSQSVWPRHALSVRGNAPRPPRPRWPSALSPSPRMCARAAFTLRTPASCSLKSFVR